MTDYDSPKCSACPPLRRAAYFQDKAEKAEAEVERLRKLCAERPPDSGEHNFEAFHKWLDKIDAAGRGEG